jgi:lipoprotein signal peptidase
MPSMKSLGEKINFGVPIFLLLIAIDQAAKYLIRSRGGFYICNQNISWNIPVADYLFWPIYIIVIITLFFLLFNKKTGHLPIVLILSGAFSNIIDRIRFDCVIDFIQFPFWPIFNLADTFIVLGAIFLLVKWLKL